MPTSTSADCFTRGASRSRRWPITGWRWPRGPRTPPPRSTSGSPWKTSDRHAEAIEAYQRALSVAPDTADAHYNLARLFEQTGQSEAAIRHLLVYRRLTKKRR